MNLTPNLYTCCDVLFDIGQCTPHPFGPSELVSPCPKSCIQCSVIASVSLHAICSGKIKFSLLIIDSRLEAKAIVESNGNIVFDKQLSNCSTWDYRIRSSKNSRSFVGKFGLLQPVPPDVFRCIWIYRMVWTPPLTKAHLFLSLTMVLHLQSSFCFN